MNHPCLTCGACCASYRVSFHYLELDRNSEFQVPEELAEQITPNHFCMKGTGSKHNPKCTALDGRIGVKVNCTIYHNRPSVCREFIASYENGTKEIRCDEARSKHGLPPLNKSDFKK